MPVAPIVWIVISAGLSVQSGHMMGVSEQHRVDHKVMVSDCNTTAKTASRVTGKSIKGQLKYTNNGAECRLNIPKGTTITEKQWRIIRTVANPNTRTK